jgi:hypothetical protein
MRNPQSHVEISPARWDRWIGAAAMLGEHGTGLALELRDARRDPTRHLLGRAARAARIIERITSGELHRIANVTATEIETDLQ